MHTATVLPGALIGTRSSWKEIDTENEPGCPNSCDHFLQQVYQIISYNIKAGQRTQQKLLHAHLTWQMVAQSQCALRRTQQIR